jgi:hypothetical protein
MLYKRAASLMASFDEAQLRVLGFHDIAVVRPPGLALELRDFHRSD